MGLRSHNGQKTGERYMGTAERKAHEAWGILIQKHPAAARLMLRLVANLDRRGAVIVSQKTLVEMMGVHRNTVGKAVKALEAGNWIDTVRLGAETGGVKAYLVNRRAARADKRENQKYTDFDARVIAAVSEQPSENLKARRQLPRVGEYPLPEGDGMEPSSQQLLGACRTYPTVARESPV